MNDTARHTIPHRLDDPERWLFCTVDEVAALMGPALLGLAANQFVPGLVAGVGGWLLLRRVKRGGGGQHRALRALLVPAGLRAVAQTHAGEPPAALRRLRATLDWVEAELLQTRGWDPATRRRPRVKTDGMVGVRPWDRPISRLMARWAMPSRSVSSRFRMTRVEPDSFASTGDPAAG